MEDFVELGITGVDKVVDKYGDNIYDTAQRHNPLSSSHNKQKKGEENNKPADEDRATHISDRSARRSEASKRRGARSRGERPPTELPSPERESEDYYYRRSAGDSNNVNLRHSSVRRSDYFYSQEDREFERQSETSERVLRDYENEQDDPKRRPDERHTRARNMSNGYGYDNRRPTSQQPPRSRHYDDGDSDYDDRTGTVYRKTSRGYDDGYDREIVETERYRGPARNWDNARSGSYQDDSYAVAPYRRSGDVAYDEKRRSRSRGRDDRDSYYGDGHHHHHRDRSDSRERESFKDKLDGTFDKSARGIGVGIAGAVVGGLIGRQVGNVKHAKRDMVIGAVIGGLGANAAEQKYRDWSEEKREERREERLSVAGYDDGYRSRSSHR